MLIYWIWFAELKLSLYKKDILLQYFHDPEEVYYAEEGALRRIPEATPDMMEALEDKDLESAHRILRACRDKNISIITKQDTLYPQKLRNISDPPLVLYYRGNFPVFDRIPAVGTVGTRKASAYGLSAARRFGSELAACGVTVVSGGASGIDSMAMEGAIAVDAGPVCVLGCGVDVVYPASNRVLFDRTTKKGCLISEYPPGTPGRSWNFPQRNRIISGLSDGVLVVEAPERSGALITAKLAMEQGRDLFVVPANFDASASAGSNGLLRSGGIAVFGGWDIAREYESRYPGMIHNRKPLPPLARERSAALEKVAQEPAFPGNASHTQEKSDKKDIDNGGNSSYSVSRCAHSDLTEQERTVLGFVTREPISVDEVIAHSGMPSGAVLSTLTMLAMKGAVENHPGRRVSLK